MAFEVSLFVSLGAFNQCFTKCQALCFRQSERYLLKK